MLGNSGRRLLRVGEVRTVCGPETSRLRASQMKLKVVDCLGVGERDADLHEVSGCEA